MKITNAYVNITSPGRNFVTLKVETDEGSAGRDRKRDPRFRHDLAGQIV